MQLLWLLASGGCPGPFGGQGIRLHYGSKSLRAMFPEKGSGLSVVKGHRDKLTR